MKYKVLLIGGFNSPAYSSLLKQKCMVDQDKRLFLIMLTVAILLLIPFIAMQFSGSGVNWSPLDFLAAAILLMGTGLACELVLRKVKKTSYQFAICGVILFALALIWIELAVGLFGTPFAGS